RLFHDTSRLELRIGDRHATLRHRLPGDLHPPRQGAEFLIASWVRAGRAITGVDWSPLEVRFAHAAPAVSSDHERFFRAPIRFAMGENSFSFAVELLALPCARADATLAALIDRYAAERISRASGSGGLADRARSLLETELRSGEVSAGGLAKRLGMSVRSLNRVLVAEGTTYQALLDGLRHELAARQLTDTSSSVWEVAFQLGFSDLSAFYRAFRRWTGTTPAEFRARAGAPRG
ncbi:MAG TPA: helix-turn-helix domain-containing protein, partial [Dongiaceae bacterium]|nr:helix-turn-helix domain-containing protein [Dongiaceae bacterium]